LKLLKAAVVVSFLLSLSACDAQQDLQKEVKNKIVEFQSRPSKENKPSVLNQIIPSSLYGFWVNENSYLVISNYHGRYQLKQYVKNESENTRIFSVTTQNKNNFSGIFVNTKNLGDEISLELNKQKNKLTISTKNGEETYKSTEVDSDTYLKNF
jgi:Na+-translocating ferredoxin:NAD+ oxidoreductase RnfG subunit